MALSPNSGAMMYQGGGGSMIPRLALPPGASCASLERPHPEWMLSNLRWRWLMDTWEGGETYRQAIYGYDLRGLPVRNMIRHKREYPQQSDATYSTVVGRPDGTDQAAQATDDDYELRRARTPVPTLLSDVIAEHVAKIYNREIDRDDTNPKALSKWWEDVDGCGSTIDQWMADVVDPILIALGQVDVLLDHPPAPEGEEVRSLADEKRLGLDKCVGSIILPENVVWWTADRFGEFEECVVREGQDCGGVRWRYWNEEGWALYDEGGNPIDCCGKILDAPTLTPHAYGVVPIIRLFDRKRPRSKMIGLPRYEALAEIQRELYNRDSELILSDTTQAHPLLQGPEDFIQPDGTLPIGPNWLLPKKKNQNGGTASYEGFDVVQFPKDGAESIRLNKQDLINAADRVSGMTKPAGGSGSTGATVAQSGISKRLDADKGYELLGKVAKTLERAEQRIAKMALVVMANGKPSPADLAAVSICYPTEFDLMSAEELADTIIKLQAILSAMGDAPETEGAMIQRLVRIMMPGLSDDDYKSYDDEITESIATKAKQREVNRESDMNAEETPLPNQPANQASSVDPAINDPRMTNAD